MFRAFDDDLGALHIATYGVSVTTMEEVFLHVAQGEDVGEEAREVSRRFSERMSSRDLTALSEKNEDGDAAAAGGGGGATNRHDALDERFDMSKQPARGMFFSHFWALLVKRFHYARRDWKMIAFQLFIPCLALALGSWLLAASAPQDEPALPLDTALLNPEIGGTYAKTTRMPYLVTNREEPFYTASVASFVSTYAPAGGEGVPFQAPAVDYTTYADANVCPHVMARDTCELDDNTCARCPRPRAPLPSPFPLPLSPVPRRGPRVRTPLG